jgi:hypothetical protein
MMRIIGTLLYTLVAVAASLGGQEDSSDVAVAPDGIVKYSRGAYEAGRRDAERDVREGRLIYEIYGGPPAPWEGGWKKVLADKYQIQLKSVAGCVVNHSIVGHARGYNEVAGAEIDRKFGPNFIMKSRDDFRNEWEKRRK